MRKLIISAAFLVLAFAFIAEAKPAVPRSVDGYFYTALTPHGVWMEIGSGVIVWRPTVMRTGWQPYSIGRWIWSADGWYWDSYEDFGYITYHYGRWHYDDFYGWLWVPDYEWAPSWVEWRYDNDYIGWAPLSPYAAFTIGIGLHYTYDYYAPYNHWHYVNYNYFYDPYLYKHYVASEYKYRIHSRTKYRNNFDYRDGRVVNRGVDIDVVRKRSGQDIREREIQRYSDPLEVRGKNSRDKDVLRTFVADRDLIKRERAQKLEVKRSDRKINLDVAKIELGDRRGGEKTVIYREAINERKVVNDREEKQIERNKETNTDRNIGVRKQVNESTKNDSRTTDRNDREIIKRNSNDEKRNVNPPVIERKEERTQQTAERQVVKTNTAPKIERKVENRKIESRNESSNQKQYQRPPEQKREVKQPVRNNSKRSDTNKNSGGTREHKR